MLFVGDDWAEDHHDIEIVDAAGRVLVRRRLPEGVSGVEGVHMLVADHLGDDDEPGDVVVGIESDRGPWVQALIAAGYLAALDRHHPSHSFDSSGGAQRRSA